MKISREYFVEMKLSTTFAAKSQSVFGLKPNFTFESV